MKEKDEIIVMIGKPNGTIFLELAKEYKFACDKMILVSRYTGNQSFYKDEKISYISTIEYESFLLKILIFFIIRIMQFFYFFASIFCKRNNEYRIIESVVQAISVYRYVNKIKNVKFVVAHNVFIFGLASLLCKKHIRVMRPWGGDIYQYALASKLNFRLTKYVLNNADIVDAISPAVYKYLQTKYGLQSNIVLNASSSYMGAAEVIEIKKKYSKEKVRKELGIPTDKKIIVNCRRFKEKWGSEEIFKSFMMLAEKHEDLHFVLLSGGGSEEKIAAKKKIITNKGMNQRFTLFEKTVDLETYVKIIFSSDIFFSLMHEADLRSASIMTGLHCDSLPVISDQPEYHEMVNEGAMMQIVPFYDMDKVVNACEKYLFDEEFVQQTLESNSLFVEDKVNNNEQFTPLLDRVEEIRNKKNNYNNQ